VKAQGQDGFWYVYNDGTGIQTPSPNSVIPLARPGANGTGYSLETSGSDFTDWGAGLGVNLNHPANGPLGTYDASAFKCLTFWAKSPNANTISVALATLSTTAQGSMTGGNCVATATKACNDHYGYDIHLTSTFQKYTINFANLRQQGWGVVAPGLSQELSRILSLNIQVLGFAPFDFSIDEVAFSTTCGATSPGYNGPIVIAGDQTCVTSNDCSPGSGASCYAPVGTGYSLLCTASCTYDSDCPTDHTCITFDSGISAYCLHNCSFDSDCPNSMICSSGVNVSVCTPSDWYGSPCTTSLDCATGYTCIGGYCQ
jgi:hypothetical protein